MRHLVGIRRRTPRPSAGAAQTGGHERSRGQALVEFALVVPIITLLLLAILDFSRVFSAVITVESAAREAADFGAFGPEKWDPKNEAGTLQAMVVRACAAARSLPDFDPDRCGPDAGDNPLIRIQALDKRGDQAPCHQVGRGEPCLVEVDIDYAFPVINSYSLDFLGVRIGLPATVPITRSSVFAISDYGVDL